MDQSDTQLTPEQLQQSPARIVVQTALRRGDTPATIIRELAQLGLPAHEIAALIRHVAHDLAAERRFTTQSAHAVGRHIISELQAGRDALTLERDLHRMGVRAEQAQQLVAAARSAWTARETRRRRHTRRQILERATLGVLAAAVAASTSWLADRRAVLQAPRTALPEVAVDQDILALTPAQPNAVVVSLHANARTGPSPEYPVLQQLAAQTPLRVIGWAAPEERYLIQLADARAAWVRSDPAIVQLTVPPESLPRFRITP